MDAEALKGRALQVDVNAISRSPECSEGEAKQTQVAHKTEDRWICSRLNQLISNVSRLMEDFQFGEVEQQIYDFTWSEFCDWYVEIAKIRLRNQSTPSPLPFLVNTLETSLRLLHPFMPFITEELWQSLKQRLPNNDQMPASIMIAPYPIADNKSIDPEAEQAMDAVIEIVRSIRNARSQYRVAPSKWIEAQIYADEFLPYIACQAKAIEILGRVHPLTILAREKRKAEEEALVMVLKGAELVLPWAGMIDRLAERERLIREREITQARIAQLNARLRNSAFLTKAPPHIIEKEKEKLRTVEDKLERLKLELSQLN